MVTIALIVEGHGECEAVPILIRRIAQEIDPGFVPHILRPHRVPVAKLTKQGEIERSEELAARKLEGEGGIVILVDCDDGCPAKDGPELLRRARAARSDIKISVILAKKEFEAWFITAVQSLSGKPGLSENLQSPNDPESIRGAKEWLNERMLPGFSYSETTDQPALAECFDMQAAKKSDSFDKCYRDIRGMLENLKKQSLE